MKITQRKQAGFSLYNIPKQVLYGILFVVCSVSLVIPLAIPNRVADSSADLYKVVMELPTDKPVFIQTDWTGSTRGESRSQFQALMRMLMRRGIKFGFFSVGDPQAPEVARGQIRILNEERRKAGLSEYKPWDDYVFVGYFSGAEASVTAMSSNLRNFLGTNRDTDPAGVKRPVIESPILANVTKVDDLGAYFIITGSKTSRIAIERLSGKVVMICLVTGVMGPETYNYYQTGQLSGLSIGLKGAYDLESMMEHGLNQPGGTVSNVHVKDQIPGFPGMKNLDNGQRYIVPLHGAIILLIAAVVIGNIQTIRERKRGSE